VAKQIKLFRFPYSGEVRWIFIGPTFAGAFVAPEGDSRWAQRILDRRYEPLEVLEAQVHARSGVVAAMKRWALDHYDQGADTFVECWEDVDYAELLHTSEWDQARAMRRLAEIASVFADRQSNARNER
jgi:hypothetical protein